MTKFISVILVVYILSTGNAIELGDKNGYAKTADKIRRFMDVSVNPCDNFYKYACGRYSPAENDASNAIDEFHLKFNRIIEEQILNLTSSANDHPITKYAREVYHNCLTSKHGIDSSTVGHFFRKALSTPECLNPCMFNSSGGNFGNYISEITAEWIVQFSLAIFFDVGVGESVEGNGQLLITEPSFYITDDLKTYPNIKAALITYVHATLREFSEPHKVNRTDVKEVIRFEQNLLRICGLNENKTGHEVLTVREMDKLNNNNYTLSPRRTMDHLLKKSGRIPLQDDDEVRIFNSAVLKEILFFISNTQYKTLVNYLRYRLAMSLVLFSNSTNLIKLQTEFDFLPLFVTETPPGLPIGNSYHHHEHRAAVIPAIKRLELHIHPMLWMEPSYNQEWPEFLKNSGLGHIMGHEMMHVLYMVVPEWVRSRSLNSLDNSEDLIAIFLQRRRESLSFLTKYSPFFVNQCIVDHYGHLFQSELKQHSVLQAQAASRTFEENFADIGGLQLAYLAYKSVFKRDGGPVIEKGLPGLTHYSNDQLFFLNYAQNWCDDDYHELLMEDVHSPNYFRVLGTLRNNEDFASSWNCPLGSFMNPVHKCRTF